MAKPSLKRSLSLTQMVLYGLGTTIGAGIYVLVGKLAGTAGYLSVLSFIVAAFMAAFTALSFAELSGRFPRAGGSATFVRHGFNSISLSTLVGVLVITAGVVSSAALVNGFSEQLHEFWQLDLLWSKLIVVLVIGLIAFWGISESVTIAAVITLIEVGGLVLIIFVSSSSLLQIPEIWHQLSPSMQWQDFNAIFAGSLLAFYAFIGFEDMVVVAEEVKNVRRNLPLAILVTLMITMILYVLVMLAAMATLHPQQLAQSHAPLAAIYQANMGGGKVLFGLIGLFAIINGALIQLIMSTRMVYGLSRHKQLPAWLSSVHPYTRTPGWATLLVTLALLLLTLLGTVEYLAKMTSLIMLAVFTLVNIALIRVKNKRPAAEGVMVFPVWIPWLGFLVSSGFVFLEVVQMFFV